MLCAGVGMLVSFGAVLLALFVAAALLRAAVAVANRVAGSNLTETVVGWEWDSADDEDEVRVAVGVPPIPEPGVARGMVIVFLAAAANAVALYALGVVVFEGFDAYDDWTAQALVYALAALVGFAALVGLLAAMLPTTVRRAALAALFAYLLLLALAALVAGLVAVVLG
ncbi:Uncharacterized protein OS=Planctomyces maris DSM 8797 GN=PM8797T_19717 PE=4 SV=1 [Gemmataceae bacterium]|nr:Uncharacterized protein OS=Planctomyces maris DSM 8797 GN=PM8797T_19717 PE=4 SV=1 [Gemmataceae bacterium]VTU00169.1 Uncharacterized protein OS=Planctomyces maris DSM 8797 GN=PM8797T_19717 PE=4 SV=1 [Gemmataceae bacterium]